MALNVVNWRLPLSRSQNGKRRRLLSAVKAGCDVTNAMPRLKLSRKLHAAEKGTSEHARRSTQVTKALELFDAQVEAALSGANKLREVLYPMSRIKRSEQLTRQDIDKRAEAYVAEVWPTVPPEGPAA